MNMATRRRHEYPTRQTYRYKARCRLLTPGAIAVNFIIHIPMMTSVCSPFTPTCILNLSFLDSREGIVYRAQPDISLWLLEMIVNAVRPSDPQTAAILSQVSCTMKPPELPFPGFSLKLY